MFSAQQHRYIYLFGLFSLAYGMMMGAVPTSIPTLILFGNWLLEGRFVDKWQNLKNNVVFWSLSFLFVLHLLGLLWTSNLIAGWEDVKTKAPLIGLALALFCASPLSKKEMQWVLLSFLLGSITNTLWCLVYSFVLHHNETIRNASRFMSHIRLGLFLDVAIVVCLWLSLQWKQTLYKILMYLLAVYFLLVLSVLGLASGIVNFIVLAFIILCIVIFRLPFKWKLMASLLLVGGIFIIWHYVDGIWRSQLTIRKSSSNVEQTHSPSGRIYYHEDLTQKENGNYVRLNMQLQELQKGWKDIFPEDSFSYEPQHNLKRFDVLVRYLASKGFNKDSVGMSRLNQEDRENIRKGIVNYQYPRWSYLHRRTYELVNEIDAYINRSQINGHSLTMRLYFWTAALDVIKRHPLIGVGTGDVQESMDEAYARTGSPLSKEWHKRPHNQFLTVTVALGIIGLLIFCFCLIYPAVTVHKHLSWVYWLFFITAVLSFVTEDTLETQAGLTFFAFFQTLFISQAWFEKKKQLKKNPPEGGS